MFLDMNPERSFFYSFIHISYMSLSLKPLRAGG